MKKNTEQQPIDDLFARKLSKMSLPPSPDGFERLQKRMNRNKPAVRLILWRNPTSQRYMTAAACLGLMCLFGWLYWRSAKQTTLEGVQVATNYPLTRHSLKPVEKQAIQAKSAVSHGQKNDRQLAITEETTINRKKRPSTAQFDNTRNLKRQLKSSSTIPSESALTQVEPAKATINLEDARVRNTLQVDQLTTEQGAGSLAAVKANATAERVLIVTIEEPASLVAARQKARNYIEEKAALTANNKAEKETKGNVWQQVKRFKEGELFARQNKESADEQGLLDRAYNGLKHSLDKNKPIKQ